MNSAHDELIESLQRFDTCTLLNAIETFGIRLRNEGYARPGLQWLSSSTQRMIGFASTLCVRSADPPMRGQSYSERTDWWQAVADSAGPRVAVIHDVDEVAGIGSVAGEVHAAILQRLGCVGLITNGSVRDIEAIDRLGFAVCAKTVSPSHAYEHTVYFDKQVEILGLIVNPGDLIVADRSGVVQIPMDIAPQLPAIAAELEAHDRKIVDLCKSDEFSLEKLREAVK